MVKLPISVPAEVKSFLGDNSLENYPFVSLPHSKIDSRGEILNLLDGVIGDVAIIKSKKASIRASHYHLKDWHFIYLLSGRFIYEYGDGQNLNELIKYHVSAGNCIFTPPLVFHKLTFVENSNMIVVSGLSRVQKNYEEDTVRL